jgi:hypothetical protein
VEACIERDIKKLLHFDGGTHALMFLACGLCDFGASRYLSVHAVPKASIFCLAVVSSWGDEQQAAHIEVVSGQVLFSCLLLVFGFALFGFPWFQGFSKS